LSEGALKRDIPSKGASVCIHRRVANALALTSDNQHDERWVGGLLLGHIGVEPERCVIVIEAHEPLTRAEWLKLATAHDPESPVTGERLVPVGAYRSIQGAADPLGAPDMTVLRACAPAGLFLALATSGANNAVKGLMYLGVDVLNPSVVPDAELVLPQQTTISRSAPAVKPDGKAAAQEASGPVRAKYPPRTFHWLRPAALVAGVLFVATLGVMQFYTARLLSGGRETPNTGTSGLNLQVRGLPERGGYQVSWNKDAVRGASHGRLIIGQGLARREAPLDGDTLSRGSLFILREGNDFAAVGVMRLEVSDAGDGRLRSETVALALSALDERTADINSNPPLPAGGGVLVPYESAAALVPGTRRSGTSTLQQSPSASDQPGSRRTQDGAGRDQPDQPAPIRPAVPFVAPAKQTPPRPELPVIAAPQTTAGVPSLDLHVGTALPQAALPPAPAPPVIQTKASPESQPAAVGQVESAVPIHRAYPKTGDRLPVQTNATVRIEVQLDEQGIVTAARWINGPMFLSQECLAAAKKWQYSPAKIRGVPVKSAAVIEFLFRAK